MREPPVRARDDVGDGVGDAPLGAGQGLVALGQHVVSDEQLPQVVGGPAGPMGVEGLVGTVEPTGGKVGEQRGGSAVTQPVQGAARGGGRTDRRVHAGQVVGDGGRAGAQDVVAAAAQAAGRAPAPVVELVLPGAVLAPRPGRQPGAVGAGRGRRAGWADQAALGAAPGADPAASLLRHVAGVADRSFRPTHAGRS